MAHHSSTPQGVLDAPEPTITVVSGQHGLTRQERRHGLVIPHGLTAVEAADYRLKIQMAGVNVPHRGAPRRGRRVRRNRVAS